MLNPLTDNITFPPEQQAIRAKCFHPSGSFSEFKKQDVEQSIAERFEQQVLRYQDRLAVRSKSHQLTYRELNEAANRIARTILLRQRNGNEPIALLLEHGEPLFAPILGVLKSGNFFVPLDPSHPPAHTRHMLDDSRAGLIITNNRNAALAAELFGNNGQLLNVDEIDRTLSCDNLGLTVSPDAISNILYTSGSTGQPKGVIQTHRNNLHTSMVYAQTFNFCPEDRLTLLASVTAQAILSIYGGILNGCSFFPLNVKEEGIASLAEWVIQEEITIYHSASPLFRNFIETLTGEEEFPSVRMVKLASQTVFPSDVELYKKWFSSDCILVNGLSSTETIGFRIFFMDKNSHIATNTVPVGYPVADKDIRLLDENGYEVAPNQVGEIVVKSHYLSPGYWGKPELTQETFLPDPNGGNQRVFHTGDMGRMLSDGCLEHLGRKDFQLKIRGNRVEISEIEAALLSLDGVKDAVVVAQTGPSGDRRLAAFIVPAVQPPPTVAGLRDFLAETLPNYMVPTYLVLMDALPQLPDGKVDRQALPTPNGGRPELRNRFVGPRNYLEEELCTIWTKVLGLDRVGIHDDFLELGGDSLLASTLMTRIAEVFRNELPLYALIQAPTVSRMASILRHETMIYKDSPLVAIQPKGDKPPFFCIGGVGGHVFGLTALSRHLGNEQPFYGLESPGRDGEQPPLTRIEDMASLYIAAIRQIQPNGPYFLGSYSWGGRVVFEVAQQLHAAGEEIALLTMFDSGCPMRKDFWSRGRQILSRCDYFARRALYHIRQMISQDPSARRSHLKETAEVVRQLALAKSPVWDANVKAGKKYVPKPYPGKLIYFWTNDRPEGRLDRRRGWWRLVEGGVDVHRIPGGHTTFLREPHVQTLARLLRQCLESAQVHTSKNLA